MSNYNTNIPERVTNLFSENYTQPTEPETIQDFVSETLSSLTEALNYKKDLHLTGADQKFYQRFSTMEIPEEDKRRILIASFKLIFDNPGLISHLKTFFNKHPDLSSKEFSQILERIGSESWTQKAKCERLIKFSPLLNNIPSTELPSIIEHVDNMDPGQRDIACEIMKEIPKSEKSTQFINTLFDILKNCQTIYDDYDDDVFSEPDPPPRDVKDALMAISKDKWLTVFSFFDKVESPYNPVTMIKDIANTPTQQREIIYKLLPEERSPPSLIQRILSMPSEIRDPFITCLAAHPNQGGLLKEFVNTEAIQKEKIIQIITAIPSGEVTLEILTFTLNLFKSLSLQEDDHLGNFNSDDDSLGAPTYYSDIEVDTEKQVEHTAIANNIHSIISSTPENERVSLLTLLSKSNYSTPQESVSCLEEIAKFSQSQKELLLSMFGRTHGKIPLELFKEINQQQNVELFLKEIQSKTTNYPSELINYLRKQPPGKWVEYLNLVHKYTQSDTWLQTKVFIGSNINHACSVLSHASDFVVQHQVDSTVYKHQILESLSQIPEDEILDVLSTASQLQDGTDFKDNIPGLIDAIVKIPYGSRESLLKKMAPLLAIYTNSSDHKYLLLAFSATEPEDYEQVTKAILPLINKESPLKFCGKLIIIASLLPTNEQNTETIKAIEKLYDDDNKDYVRDSFWFSNTITYYPRNERSLKAIQLKLELSEVFSKYYVTIPEQYRNMVNVEILGSLLKEINADDEWFLNAVLRKLPFENPVLTPLIFAKKLVQTNSLSFFYNIMYQLTNEQLEKLMGNDSQENLKTEVERYLLLNLEESVTTRVKAYKRSRVIANLVEDGLFSEDSTLFQRAMEIAIDTDPAAQSDPLSPYVFHQNLLKTINEEELIDIPQSGQPPWNVSTLREKASRRAYTFADLPPNVQNSTLTSLFQDLEKRIGDDQAIQDYIEETQGISYSSLKANLLNKPLILSLCNSTGQPTKTIDVAKFQLFSILSVILENSPTKLAHDSPLTEREEMLLSFSNSVNNCSVGQRGGIADYFNSLNAVFNAADSDRVTSYVDASVQKLILNAISEEKLLEKLGCNRDHQGAIAQATHQIAYILARYHKQIGVQHQIFFDRHPRTISSNLTSKPPEEALKIIFEYITVDKMIKRLCSDVANKFQQSNLAQNRLMKAKKQVSILRKEIEQVNEQTELVRLQKKHGKVKDFQKLVELRDEKLSELKKQLEVAEKLEKEAKESWDAAKGRDINYSVLSEFLKGEGELMELILFNEETYEPMGLTEKGARVILKKIGYIN